MAVAFRSGGWGEPDARAAAGLAGLESPRRRFAGSSSERAAWVLQAVFWAAVWSWSLCAGRLNHLGTQNGRLGAGRGSLRRGAALQRRCSPERVCRAMPRATGYGNWRKGRRGLECSSPRAWAVGLRSADDRRRGPAATLRRCSGKSLQRPERSSGLGEDPSVEAEPMRS